MKDSFLDWIKEVENDLRIRLEECEGLRRDREKEIASEHTGIPLDAVAVLNQRCVRSPVYQCIVDNREVPEVYNGYDTATCVICGAREIPF